MPASPDPSDSSASSDPSTSSSASSSIRVDVLLGPDDIAAALREDVRYGLRSDPKELPPKWFYDDRGCELFDAITRLPEYYPTETERSILSTHAAEIAAASGATTLVELGSGTSDKTRVLLDALAAGGRLEHFVPFEIGKARGRPRQRRLKAAGQRLCGQASDCGSSAKKQLLLRVQNPRS